MHKRNDSRWRDDHQFDTGNARGERGTRRVILLTVTMMVGEIVAGLLTNSMALLADGWHMETHVTALSITAFAYWYSRRHAADPPVRLRDVEGRRPRGVLLVYLREAIEKYGGLENIKSLKELRQAVIEGAVHRLRPKLLTEGVAIIGIFPMALPKVWVVRFWHRWPYLCSAACTSRIRWWISSCQCDSIKFVALAG